MGRIYTEINTNEPHTVSNEQISFMIPDGKKVRVELSVDGANYEDIFGWMYGGQLVFISGIPCNMYMKIRSTENFKIQILK